MNTKLKDFLSAKGSSIFAIVAWLAFLVGGAAFTVFTLTLAVMFEMIAQIKKKFATFV